MRARTECVWLSMERGCPSAVFGALLLLAAFSLVAPRTLAAQVVQGRIVDAENGAVVGLTGVFVLDRERNLVESAASDLEGRFHIEAPGTGQYYVVVQRLGYFENETPLLALEEGRTYGVDFELRPEPFRLDPLEVTVQNEELEQYLSLELGVNPNSLFGYRVYQGVRVEEAKLGAADNTQFFRRLDIPVTWGRNVCVGAWGIGLPPRGSRGQSGSPRCGQLKVDGYPCPAALMEKIPLDQVAVVVLLGGNVHVYTRTFEWDFRPGKYGRGC